ncbi:hypothetical protein HI806_01235 [Ralstonia solanacearum]|nr:hypothetical protein BCR16_01165 [Ralstonia solanacearum FJAT-1458]QKL70001.1 hypothetical protein HI806_01235 [Ralstonia solanacearum]QKL75213.1 hypothetical protein HI805_01235 [Ralstonia solanacearum]QKL80416.1 hypothetical protein HI804_01240 [Ralstonia solanacearum]QKL85629.1 hypothetical protein HI803_01240 [Ralstonia solanacearum]
MQLKNLADSAVLALPDDLLWADEHAWTPAVAAVSYLLTGALLVESAARQKGRSITLVGAADMAWVTRATVNTLYAWAAAPSRQFELTHTDGRVFTVVFRHHETAIEAEPVMGFPARREGDFYRLTVRLMEV